MPLRRVFFSANGTLFIGITDSEEMHTGKNSVVAVVTAVYMTLLTTPAFGWSVRHLWRRVALYCGWAK